MDNEWGSRLTINDIESHIAKHGKRGAMTVKIAADNRELYQDLQSKGGMLILNELMILMETLLEKMLAGEATPAELAEYKAYRNFFDKISNKFAAFRNATQKIKEK